MKDQSIRNLSLVHVFVIIFGSILLFLIIHFYNQRQILQEYEREINTYTQANREGLKIVFSKIFDEAEQCHTKACFQKIENEVSMAIQPNLKDFNTIYFIRLKFLNGQNTIEQLVSGSVGSQTTDPGITPSIVPVVQVLQGRVSHPIFWKNDFSGYQSREVVVPINIDRKIIGAIVRQAK